MGKLRPRIPTSSTRVSRQIAGSRPVDVHGWALFSILACFAAFLVTGCGNNPYPAGQTSRNVLYRDIQELPRDLDPTKSNFEVDATIIYNIYATYYKYDYLKHSPYTLVLSLGAQDPVRSPYPYIDKSTGKPVPKMGEAWTFRIRPGLRFQNDPCFPGGEGREILASDFIYSFRRMADPNLSSPGIGFIQDKILGYSDYIDYCNQRAAQKLPMDYNVPVEGLQVDAKDPYTFRIIVNQPYPQLRYLMAMCFTTPIAHEAIEKYGDLETHPVGSGMYVMSKIEPKLRWTLAVNPNRPVQYYPSDGSAEDKADGLLDDAGKQLPLNDAIYVEDITEDLTAWNMFEQGYEDAAGVGSTNYNQVISHQGAITPEMAAKGVCLRHVTEPAVNYYIFNMTDPVVGGYTPQKRKLRQAIMCAIDTQSYIDLFLHDIGQKAEFIIPPGLFGYDPDYHNPYSYNLEKAKQLLAEAGYPGGIDPKTGQRLQIYYDSVELDATQRQTDDWLHKQLAAVGVDLVIREVREIEWMMNSEAGRFQMMSWGWIADYPDPEDFVMLLYGKNNRQTNVSGYSNPEYDRLYEQMRQMTDSPARLAVIQRMRDISVEDCPLGYTIHSAGISIYQKWIHNIDPNPLCYDSAQYTRVDGLERARLQVAWNHPIYWPIVVFFGVIVGVSIPAAGVVNQRRNRRIRRSPGGSSAPGGGGRLQ